MVFLKYECEVCGYVFDEEKEGRKWEELADEWKCPVCDSGKSYFKKLAEESEKKDGEKSGKEENVPDRDELADFLKDYRRENDDTESHMKDIHTIAETGKSIIEPMRTTKPVTGWDDVLIMGAQLAKIPVHHDAEVKTKTVIGPKAKKPLVIETPVYVSHMSFGALSREIKIALAKGSASAKTAICSGEGGILDDEYDNAYRYIFEYVPNRYSVSDANLKKVHAVEIKIGQSTKPCLGGHLPGEKVTEEIAKVRGKPAGRDIISPPHFHEIKTKEDLKKEVSMLRKKTGGAPIGIKLAAGHIEDDLEVAVFSEPDFITIDGRPGGTGASPKFVKDSTSVPTLFALHRARKFLDRKGLKDISLVITGGLRISPDFAKALAMGADAVAIATSALMACACQQYRVCDKGKCPVGVTTHDPELRKRLKTDIAAKRLANFLSVSTEELKDFARLTGKKDVHALRVSDLCTANSEISDHTSIKHV